MITKIVVYCSEQTNLNWFEFLGWISWTEFLDRCARLFQGTVPVGKAVEPVLVRSKIISYNVHMYWWQYRVSARPSDLFYTNKRVIKSVSCCFWTFFLQGASLNVYSWLISLFPGDVLTGDIMSIYAFPKRSCSLERMQF